MRGGFGTRLLKNAPAAQHEPPGSHPLPAFGYMPPHILHRAAAAASGRVVLKY